MKTSKFFRPAFVKAKINAYRFSSIASTFIIILLCGLAIALPNSDSSNVAAYTYITSLAIDPTDTDIVYAATLGAGLYKSTNAGDNWLEINAEAGIRKYHVVALDPQNPNILYAGGESNGLWLSTNKGETWACMGPDLLPICDLAVDPTNSYRVFLLSPIGVFRSQDIRTRQWEHVFDYLNFFAQNPLPYPDLKSMYYTRWQKISINPHNPSEIFAGVRLEGGYHRSTDGGDTWQHDRLSPIFSRVDLVLFHPTDPKIRYATTHHQGVFKSYNGGQSWLSVSQNIHPQIRSPYYGATVISGMTLDPSNPDIMYAGSDYDSWKSVDGAFTWQHINNKTLTCEFSRANAVDPRRPNVVYAGTNWGIFKSIDGGASWTIKNSGFPERELVGVISFNFNEEVFEIGIDKNHRYLFRCSITNRTDWTYMSRFLYYDSLDSLAYDESQQVLTCFTSDGNVQSLDAGYTWDVPRFEYANLPSHHQQAPFMGNRNAPDLFTFDVYLSGDVFFDDAYIDGLYRRPPYIKLQMVTAGYPFDNSTPLLTFSLDYYLLSTIQIPKHFFNANQEYILFADVRDFQRNRQFGYSALPRQSSLITIEMAPELSLPGFSTVANTPEKLFPEHIQLLQNYPNPFNPETTIRFNLPKSDHVTLKIYNLAGQEIETLVDATRSAGEHQAKWHAEGLANGIYFYQLEAGKFSKTKKLILQK